jgi:hypothetical protein
MLSVRIPANGLKYQARPIRAKKDAIASRETFNSDFSKFWNGSRRIPV